MDLTTANSLAADRGFIDWVGTNAALNAALVNAGDYILKNYRIRSTLNEDERTRLDLATFLLARDILVNGLPPIAGTAQVKKQEDELKGLKSSTEYFESNADRYPDITSLLVPITIAQSNGKGMVGGILTI